MNFEQKAAAQHAGSPLLVLAGPGTGKTTTLVGRYEFLVNQNVDPKKIICCTFSKQAANELKLRISANTKVATTGLPIATFHALSLRILKSIGKAIDVPTDFKIWTKKYERENVIKQLQEAVSKAGFYEGVEEEEKSAKKALEYIDAVREELLDPEDASIRAAEMNDKAKIAHCEVYTAYEEHLNKANKIDYPRMAQLACKALSKDAEIGGSYVKSFQHILVDEFQDINLAQKILVDSFFNAGVQLWAVGDDYQAIYGFRGSRVKYMLNFQKEYPGSKIKLLKKNYRSGKKILNLAKNLSEHFLEAHQKDLNPTRDTVGKIYRDQVRDEDEEADAVVDEITQRINDEVPLSEIAVISRTNIRLNKVAAELIRRGIPIQFSGASPLFEAVEAKQLIRAVATASGVYLEPSWPHISTALYGFSKNIENETWQKKVRSLATYIIKRPPNGLNDDGLLQRREIVEKNRDVLLEFADAKKFFKMLQASFKNNDDPKKVFIGTVHKAKGLEWDSVFFMGLEDGHLPQKQSTAPKDYDEERRLAYVGITRAKNFLFFTTISFRKDQNRKDQKVDPSPFLLEMFGPEASSKKQKQDKTKPTRKEKDTHENPIFERIRNLQRKAADPACSKSEAEAAEAMAQKLMTKHNIGLKNGKLFVMPTSNADPSLYARRSREEFHKRDLSAAENEAWIRERWKAYQDKVVERNVHNSNSADGMGGDGTGWTNSSGGSGCLQEAGYTTRKDGPSDTKRQQILADVLSGHIRLPDWLSETVHTQWGAPNTIDRLRKMRNTLNVALGTQQGRPNPSVQAIKKWRADIQFLDGRLKENLATETVGS